MNRRLVVTNVFYSLLVFVSALFAWRIFTLGLADYWAVSVPVRALYWRSNHPGALSQAAQDQMAAKNYSPAQGLARLGIAAHPLGGTNYRVLAGIADVSGDSALASRLLRIASIRSPRDSPVHGRLAIDALKHGDIDEALHQFDLIMRLAPTVQADLLPRMAALAALPAADPAFVRILAKRPSWRQDFLQILASQARAPDAVARIFSRLQVADPQSLSDEERTYWISRQIRDHDWSSAYVAWVASLPGSYRRALGNVFDGNFVFPPTDSGFGWQMPAVAGAMIETVAAPAGASGNALVIEFDGFHMLFHDVSQLLVLSPGSYVLRGKAKADALDTGRGLQWVLSCAEGPQTVLASSPLLIGTQAWTDFAIPFIVPGNQCGGQTLRLQMGAPDRVSGRASYAALGVDKVPAAAVE